MEKKTLHIQDMDYKLKYHLIIVFKQNCEH